MKVFPLLAALILLLAGQAQANDVVVKNAWAMATPPGTKVGAVYFSITNPNITDRLLSAKAQIAKKAEFHTSISDGNVMKMRRIDGGVAVPKHGTLMFEPGGLHVMLFGLKAPIKAGETFPLTLRFKNAGNVVAHVKAMKPGATMRSGGAMKHKMN